MVKRHREEMFISEHADGDYVLHSDYTALQASHARLLEALKAAMAFINAHVADPDITREMVERYAELQQTKPGEAIAAAQPFTET